MWVLFDRAEFSRHFDPNVFYAFYICGKEQPVNSYNTIISYVLVFNSRTMRTCIIWYNCITPSYGNNFLINQEINICLSEVYKRNLNTSSKYLQTSSNSLNRVQSLGSLLEDAIFLETMNVRFLHTVKAIKWAEVLLL